MNYLAHFYLAKESEGLIVGNFIADFVKGNKYLDYQSEIARGIRMHREIDTFTDSHAVVLETKKRLFDHYHKYAGVVVDIYYDHYLAKSWHKYSVVDLSSFSENIYQVLFKYIEIMPAKAQYVLQYMSSGDWLGNYASIQGIGRTLNGLSKRTKYRSGIENATKELLRDFDLIEKEFNVFFPQLESHVSQYNEQ